MNSGSVAKRQQLRSDANAQKVLAEEREKERVLAAAWAVGANERRARREAAQEEQARARDQRCAAKDSALREEDAKTLDAPRIVNRKLQKRSQSADDLLGLALMEEAFHRQAGRKKAAPASPKKGDPAADAGGPRATARGDVVFATGNDLLDVPRNTNHDVEVEEARTLDDAIQLLNMTRSKSGSHLPSSGKLVDAPPKGVRKSGSNATLGARRGVRKVLSKSSFFDMESNMEAIAIG